MIDLKFQLFTSFIQISQVIFIPKDWQFYEHY